MGDLKSPIKAIGQGRTGLASPEGVFQKKKQPVSWEEGAGHAGGVPPLGVCFGRWELKPRREC